MKKDSGSYRVPTLRLSDLLKGGDDSAGDNKQEEEQQDESLQNIDIGASLSHATEKQQADNAKSMDFVKEEEEPAPFLRDPKDLLDPSVQTTASGTSEDQPTNQPSVQEEDSGEPLDIWEQAAAPAQPKPQIVPPTPKESVAPAAPIHADIQDETGPAKEDPEPIGITPKPAPQPIAEEPKPIETTPESVQVTPEPAMPPTEVEAPEAILPEAPATTSTPEPVAEAPQPEAAAVPAAEAVEPVAQKEEIPTATEPTPMPTPKPSTLAVGADGEPLDMWEMAQNKAVAPGPQESPVEPPASEPVAEAPQPEAAAVPAAEAVEQATPEVTNASNIEQEAGPVVAATPTPQPEQGNLAALRERVLHGQEVGSEGVAQPQAGAARKREKELVKTDLQMLENVRDALGGETDLLAVDTEGPRPSTKHASALADVANTLQNLPNETLPGAVANQPQLEGTTEEAPKDAGTEEGAPTQNAPGVVTKETVRPSAIPMIRTFRGDVEKAVTRDRTSVVDMISAEERRRTGADAIRLAPRQKVSSLSYVFVGASLALAIGAVGIGVFMFLFFLRGDGEVSELTETIKTNETISYDVTGQGRDELMYGLSAIRDAANVGLGSMTDIRMTERVASEEGDEADVILPVTANRFFDLIDAAVPGPLRRSIGDDVVLGVHEYGHNTMFLIFTVEANDIAFRNMFNWEKTMDIDLDPLFGSAYPREWLNPAPVVTTSTSTATSTATSTVVVATSTATTTVPVAEPDTINDVGYFEDIVVSNLEARGLRQQDGEITLVWAQPDDFTIIIAGGPDTLRVLRERMTATPY